MVRLCWKPSGKGDDGDVKGRIDGLLWYKDLGKHLYGEYSMAVVQANSTLEDHCHLASGHLSSDPLGPKVTFIGVYDGHGGTEASRFVSDNLFNNFKSFAAENKGISETVIRKAFLATEEGFLSLVKKQWLNKPQIASSGSCCLAGIICKNMLYIANAGDSRAVLGRVERETRVTSAIQLSSEHNVNIETERDELRSKHPYDSQIVVMKHKVWRVKGLIQVSRSIGDAYLKKAEFNKAPLPYKFRLYEPFFKPILSCEPTISIHKLTPDDPFIIFASDGLWEQLSNQEAVNIVSNNPHKGIAKQLVKAALRKAAKKREMRFSDLQKIEKGVRRHFHDDITVIVVFLDPEMIYTSLYGPPRSIRDGRIINPYP